MNVNSEEIDKKVAHRIMEALSVDPKKHNLPIVFSRIPAKLYPTLLHFRAKNEIANANPRMIKLLCHLLENYGNREDCHDNLVATMTAFFVSLAKSKREPDKKEEEQAFLMDAVSSSFSLSSEEILEVMSALPKSDGTVRKHRKHPSVPPTLGRDAESLKL